jgi:DNA-binding NtrC family response regulator
MLSGARILIVEDEFLIADIAAEWLTELGATVVGSAPSVSRARAMIEQGGLDGALIDMNLNGERSDPLVALLKCKSIPFVIASGYGSRLAPEGSVVLEKPYTLEALKAAFDNVLAEAG